MPGGSRPCILIVEDEPLVADGLRGIMDELDLGTCQVAQSVQEAVSAAYEWQPLLIIWLYIPHIQSASASRVMLLTAVGPLRPS